MAIIGHIYPFFMSFKGGKGMACFMGMCFGINPLFGMYVLLATIAITIITDYVAVASMTAYIAFPILLAFYPETILGPEEVYNIYIVTLALAVGLVGIWKHRVNISNLLNKKEKGLRGALKKHSK
jgi:glycerol-3-phosphate acyltransferase PlsY